MHLVKRSNLGLPVCHGTCSPLPPSLRPQNTHLIPPLLRLLFSHHRSVRLCHCWEPGDEARASHGINHGLYLPPSIPGPRGFTFS